MKKCILGALLYLNAYFLSAQDESFHTWSDFNYQYASSARFSFRGDGGIRGVLSSSEWSNFYIRPGVQYQVNSELRLSASVAGFNTWNTNNPNSFEFRVAPEATAVWPRFDIGSFSHRGRYEARFFWNDVSANDLVVESRDQSSRFRYQLSFKSDYFNVSEQLDNFFVELSTEFFLPFGGDATETYFNQNRFVIALGQLLNKGWSYKVDFMWQRSKNTLDGDFSTNEFVIRLRVYLKQLDIK